MNSLKIQNFFEYLFSDRLPNIASWKAADKSNRQKDSIDYENTIMSLMTQVDFGFVGNKLIELFKICTLVRSRA